VSTIRVTIELVDADFRKDYDVDPEDPLNKLVFRVAKDEGVPLRTKQGRPLAWTAEGPEWRGDKEGWTDYVRTQPLAPVAVVMRERHGDRSPLFELHINIPGAGEALHEGREAAKLDDIQRRLGEREAERNAEVQAKMDALGTVEDMVMLGAEPGPPGGGTGGGAEGRIKRRGGSGAAALAVGVGVGAAAAAGAAGGAGGAAGAGGAGGRGAEGRIRRRADASDAPTIMDDDGSSEGSSKGSSSSKKGSSGSKKGSSGKKKGSSGKKKGSSGSGTGKPPWLMPAIGGGALLFVLTIVALVATSGDPEPEATPTPAPIVEEVPVDMPMATPTPKPKVAAATPTPIPYETFYSKGDISRSAAKAAGAQLSSFAKKEVKLDYTVTGDGGHTVTLKNRFTLTVGPNGGTFSGAVNKTISGPTVAPKTRMQVHYDGAKVRIKVGRKRYGPWAANESKGFPAWQFTLDPGSGIKSLRASSKVEE
jgi:hypothetical protein